MTVQDGKSLESEVASYILAYLLQNNCKASAHAFLKECDVLPSKTFIVLPETPLHTVIAEHNARLNAKVLVNTLGSESAWQELWSKLNTTLNQIKCLSEDLNSHHFQPMAKIKAQKVTAESVVKKRAGIPPQSSLSPRKRKLGSIRRITPFSPIPSADDEATSGPSSPTMQHVLDTFLDDAFPGKLADIINQCVSSDVCTDDISSEMSSETLERILSVTLSEPMLEGVFSADPTSQPAQMSAASVSAFTANTSIASSSNFSAASTSSTSTEPSLKRPKPNQSHVELFPSEHDIDNFLDQIHQ